MKIKSEDKTTPLNEMFNVYQSGAMSKRILEEKIFKFLLGEHKKIGISYYDNSDYIDFLCWFYIRLTNAIENYNYNGNSFDSYIRNLIYYSHKEFKRREKSYTDENIIGFYHTDPSEVLYVNDTEAVFKADDGWTTDSIISDINTRWMLLVLLKNYHIVDEKIITICAAETGIDKNRIFELVSKMRKIRQPKDDETELIREHAQAQYVRCFKLENRLAAYIDKGPRSDILQDRLDRGRKRLDSIRRRLKHRRVQASNSEVAQVLGVPKGTVDSTIFHIKRFLESKK